MRNIDYRCTRCRKRFKREQLTVKRAVFMQMGEGAKTLRSRVTAWLCEKCLHVDLDYPRETYDGPAAEDYSRVPKPLPPGVE